MTDPKLPVVFLSCGVFQGIIDKNTLQKTNPTVKFLDPGLHAVPKKLNSVVQDQIDTIKEPSIIMLGYGLCGNGLNNIKAGIHTLLIPKMDDCIAMFMGSRKTFRDEFFSNPGTYYLTKGWLEAKTHPLAEYKQHVIKYGEEVADYIMDQQYKHYSQLTFVAHNQEDLDQYRPIALEIAEFCKRWDMEYGEYLGNDKFLQQIESSIHNPENLSDEIIMVSPGETLTQEMFS